MEDKKTYYVTWEDRDGTTAQVVTVTASCNELGAVALAAPRCKCYDKTSVRVFTEEQLKQFVGKRKSCRCYSGDVLLVFVEEYTNKIEVGNTQFYDARDNKIDVSISKLLLTLLVYTYEHQSNMIVGSTRGFPNLRIGAAPYEVDYAEPYIE